MNRLRITTETPREIASLAHDMGRGAVKQFIRHMNEVPEHTPGAAVELPLESAVWPVTYFTDQEVESFVAVWHEIQKQQLEDAA